MDFGMWVREQRRKLGLDIKEFARRTGVDPSTISRIENGHTETSLYTAVSILLASNVTPTQLFDELAEHNLPTKQECMRAGKQAEVLSEEDVDDVRNLYHIDHVAAQTILADLFNKVLTHRGPSGGATSPRDPRFLHKAEAGSQSRFRATEVQRFLSDSPIYECTLKYPLDMTLGTILKLYESGGVVVYGDVAFVAGILNRRIATRIFSDMTASLQRSRVDLERLAVGLTERLSLTGVRMIDESLWDAEQPVRRDFLLGMIWRAAQYSAELGVARLTARGSVAEEQRWSEAEHRLVNVTVTLCRWLQYLNGRDYTWLHALRQDISVQLAKAKTYDLASL